MCKSPRFVQRSSIWSIQLAERRDTLYVTCAALGLTAAAQCKPLPLGVLARVRRGGQQDGVARGVFDDVPFIDRDGVSGGAEGLVEAGRRVEPHGEVAHTGGALGGGGCTGALPGIHADAVVEGAPCAEVDRSEAGSIDSAVESESCVEGVRGAHVGTVKMDVTDT